MTESSPAVTLNAPKTSCARLQGNARSSRRASQGRVVFGADVSAQDEAGQEVPWDGCSQGNLVFRGHWIASGYFGAEPCSGDWFPTGDVGVIDADGFITLTDRTKDLIKSGGEWISSVEIEGLIASDPRVELSAVIGLPHPKWDERPLLAVKLRAGCEATADEMLAILEGRIARWWTPDEVVFVEDIPLGATGKVDKKLVRSRFAGHTLASIKAEGLDG